MLFAEDILPASWTGIAALTLTGIFAILNKIIDNKRAADITILQNQNTKQSYEISILNQAQEECKIENKKCLEEHKKTKEQLETTRVELAVKLASADAKDKEDLQKQIDEIKKRINL